MWPNINKCELGSSISMGYCFTVTNRKVLFWVLPVWTGSTVPEIYRYVYSIYTAIAGKVCKYK